MSFALLAALVISMPAQDRLPLEDVASLLAARDARLENVSWRFSVLGTPREAPEGEEELGLEATLVRNGEKKRLTKRTADGAEETITWDGAELQWLHLSDGTGGDLFETGIDDGGLFVNGNYPGSFGLALLGQSLAGLLAPPARVVEGEAREILGRRCRAFTVFQTEEGRHCRVFLDVEDTLLALRVELFDPAGTLDGPMMAWQVTQVAEVEGVWLPMAGTCTPHASLGTDAVRHRLSVHAVEVGAGAERPADAFRQEPPAGVHVRDRETGLLDHRAYGSPEGVTVGRLERLAAALAGAAGRQPPPGLEPGSPEVADVSCGVSAAYVMLRAHGRAAVLEAMVDELGATEEESPTSLAQLQSLIGRCLPGARALERPSVELARLRDPFVLYMTSEEGATGHFAAGCGTGAVIEVFDPHAGLSTLRLSDVPERLHVIDRGAVEHGGPGVLVPVVASAMGFALLCWGVVTRRSAA